MRGLLRCASKVRTVAVCHTCDAVPFFPWFGIRCLFSAARVAEPLAMLIGIEGSMRLCMLSNDAEGLGVVERRAGCSPPERPSPGMTRLALVLFATRPPHDLPARDDTTLYIRPMLTPPSAYGKQSGSKFAILPFHVQS
jgi:hypothetical protein